MLVRRRDWDRHRHDYDPWGYLHQRLQVIRLNRSSFLAYVEIDFHFVVVFRDEWYLESTIILANGIRNRNRRHNLFVLYEFCNYTPTLNARTLFLYSDFSLKDVCAHTFKCNCREMSCSAIVDCPQHLWKSSDMNHIMINPSDNKSKEWACHQEDKTCKILASGLTQALFVQFNFCPTPMTF